MGDGFSADLGPIIDVLREEIAQRAAEIVIAQFDQRQAERWPEWMRLPTAAYYIDISKDALRKLAERGKVPYSQEGPNCALWFARSDLDEWLAAQRVEARRSS